MLKINEKNYEFLNHAYNFISVERLHNLKKEGNTIIGPRKIDYIKKRIGELGIDEVFDVSTGFDYIWSETTEQEILDEIAHIVSFLSKIEVKIIKVIYPFDMLIPGELDYTYLVVDANRGDLIKMAEAENEIIRVGNEKRMKMPRQKNNVTYFF